MFVLTIGCTLKKVTRVYTLLGQRGKNTAESLIFSGGKNKQNTNVSGQSVWSDYCSQITVQLKVWSIRNNKGKREIVKKKLKVFVPTN